MSTILEKAIAKKEKERQKYLSFEELNPKWQKQNQGQEQEGIAINNFHCCIVGEALANVRKIKG